MFSSSAIIIPKSHYNHTARTNEEVYSSGILCHVGRPDRSPWKTRQMVHSPDMGPTPLILAKVFYFNSKSLKAPWNSHSKRSWVCLVFRVEWWPAPLKL